MHILIAPNAFKNSLSAGDAARCIEKGFLESDLECTTECFPVADGGDGTGDLIIRRLNGTYAYGRFRDPLGRPVEASFGFIDEGKTAVIEMAAASGLRLLNKNELNPALCSSYGTGEMITSALDKGAKKIIITIGGSATVDGGCGILNALGVRFFDADKKELNAHPQDMMQVHQIDISGLDKRIQETDIEIWCDVQNKLLGPDGAAVVFGPQKGATPQQVAQLDAMLGKLNAITRELTGEDISGITSGGAAGGTAAFVHAFLGARLVNGIEQFLQLTGFETALERSDIVVTGEGEIDLQTLQGKAPFGVASMAAGKHVRVIALAGKVPVETGQELGKLFPVLLSIGQQPLSLEESIRLTAPNLTRVACQIGNLLAG